MFRSVPFLLSLVLGAAALAQVAPVSRPPEIPPAQSIHARNGIVAAQESRAARIGIEILDRGGNAVDAAVATAFALAVTHPSAGNIGGGGYMVIRLGERQRGQRNIAIDYRETAPAAATRPTSSRWRVLRTCCPRRPTRRGRSRSTPSTSISTC